MRRLIEIINRRTFSLPAAMLGIALLAGGCTQVYLKPVYTAEPLKTALVSQIRIAPVADARRKRQPNLVGHARDGYSMLEVFADKNAGEWVRACMTENLKRAGFEVSTAKTATGGLCVSATIRSLGFEAYFSMEVTIIIEAKLKNDRQEFFSRSFTGKFSKADWLASSGEYREVLAGAMKQCLGKMMPVLIRELEKEVEKNKVKK